MPSINIMWFSPSWKVTKCDKAFGSNKLAKAIDIAVGGHSGGQLATVLVQHFSPIFFVQGG